MIGTADIPANGNNERLDLRNWVGAFALCVASFAKERGRAGGKNNFCLKRQSVESSIFHHSYRSRQKTYQRCSSINVLAAAQAQKAADYMLRQE